MDARDAAVASASADGQRDRQPHDHSEHSQNAHAGCPG